MVRRLAAFFTAFLLCLSVSVPSFASVAAATPSNATNYFNVPAIADASAGIAMYASVPEVLNTINRSNLRVQIRCIDQEGNYRYVSARPDLDNGYFNITVPSWAVSIHRIDFMIYPGSFPNSGKYKLEFEFTSSAPGLLFSDAFKLQTVKNFTNANTVSRTDNINGTFDSDVLYLDTTIEIGSLNYLASQVYFEEGFYVSSFSGYIDISFTRLSSAASVSVPSVADYSAEDTSISIADSSASIAERTSRIAEVVEEIKTTVETSVGNVVSKLENLMDHDQALADQQIANDNANTAQILNGYDNSGLEDSNQVLSDSIKEQQDQEQQILDQISEPLDSFEFDNPITQYLSTFKLFGDFLQDLFTSSGAFADVINLSFIMGIALMVAGLYRFKGGN